MKLETITQKELIEFANSNYDFSLNDRKINYYINKKLLPLPIKKKVGQTSKDKKAENIFNYKHVVFMLELLKNYNRFGFKSIAEMRVILSGGRFTLIRELELLFDLVKQGKIEKGAWLTANRCVVSFNGKILRNLAKHIVEISDREGIEDIPFLPNFDIWFLLKNREYREKYNVNINLRDQTAYFSIKIPDAVIEKPSEYISKNLMKLLIKWQGH